MRWDVRLHESERGGVGFFFQAEDGIRDLVRSRGLGDVYKRQLVDDDRRDAGLGRLARGQVERALALLEPVLVGLPVSYTHLTLPTSDLV